MAGFRSKLFPGFGEVFSSSPTVPPDEFLRALTTIVGLDQLLENFSAKLRETLHVETVYLVLYEPITNRYVGKKAKGVKSSALEHLNFSKNDNLIRWLNVNRAILELDRSPEIVRYFSDHERDILDKTVSMLVVPLIVVNRLTGGLFIGRKTDATSFTQDELSTISMLANRSALAIEYALMYQFQEDKLKRLFLADSLATMGELAAGAAHEIRNPLTSIRSTVQFLRKDLPEAKRPMMDGIIEEVDRIDRIIQGLLSFSKSSDLHLDVIDIREILNQTLLLLEPEFRKHAIVIQKEFTSSETYISGDTSQLKQVFLNIILNSIQAMTAGGTISLTIRCLTAPNDAIEVTIGDSGCGIAEENLPRLFDPFYTTKESGTGLGLSISYGIISKHGGEIDIQSITEGQNRGTTVTIRLPKIAPHHEN
jgi:signal transduction histidine kinase